MSIKEVIDKVDCNCHQGFSCCSKKEKEPTPTPTSACNISCPISGIIDRPCNLGGTPYVLSAQAVPMVINIENTGPSNAFCTITATLSGPTDTAGPIIILPGEKKTLANQSATTLTIVSLGGINNMCQGVYDGCIVIC